MLDTAANYYLKMAGDTTAAPVSVIEDLMEFTEEQGSVTTEEVAGILDTEELSVGSGLTWSVGK